MERKAVEKNNIIGGGAKYQILSWTQLSGEGKVGNKISRPVERS